MLKIIYTFFLGILLAVFVGVGVATFYQGPTWPEPPASIQYGTGGELSESDRKTQIAYDEEVKAYQKVEEGYSRNVSITTLAFAVIFLVIGVAYAHKIDVLADGVLLGGIFTLLYSMGRGLASGDDKYRFLVVSIGVLVAIGLGYWKFVRPQNAGKSKA